MLRGSMLEEMGQKEYFKKDHIIDNKTLSIYNLNYIFSSWISLKKKDNIWQYDLKVTVVSNNSSSRRHSTLLDDPLLENNSSSKWNEKCYKQFKNLYFKKQTI